MNLFTSPTYEFWDVVKGDTLTRRLTFTEDGSAYNLTNAADIWWTLKNKPTDADADAVLQLSLLGGSIAIVTAASGIADLNILAAECATLDTRTFHWDIQLKDTDGEISTALRGRLLVRSQSTIRVS